jgi:hypothetical protein
MSDALAFQVTRSVYAEWKIRLEDWTDEGLYPKFLDWVDNEIYAYKNKHSLRSNTKGYGGKTH